MRVKPGSGPLAEASGPRCHNGKGLVNMGQGIARGLGRGA